VRAAALTLCTLVGAGCLDFNGTLDRCRMGLSPCDDAGAATGGSGGAAGGGGAAEGGGAGGGATGGGATGGGVPSDGGDVCFNGFCWENPLPQGNDLSAVWGTAPNDVWVGGDGNTLLHFDGTGWRSFQYPTANDIGAAVWVLSEIDGDFYAGLGTDQLKQFHAGQWGGAPTGAPRSVQVLSGSSASDIWAGTSTGEIHHWDGAMWTEPVVSGQPIDAILADPSGGAWYEQGNPGGGTPFVLSHTQPAAALHSFPSPVIGMWLQDGGVLRAVLHDGSDVLVLPDGGIKMLEGLSFGVNGAHIRPDGLGLAVGDYENISVTDGGGWSPVTTLVPGDYDYLPVWGVWTSPTLTGSCAVGRAGLLLRYANNEFVPDTTGPVDPLFGIAQVGADLIAIGQRGYLEQRVSATRRWVTGPAPNPMGSQYALCASSDGGFVSGGVNGLVFFWGNVQVPPTLTSVQHPENVVGLACLPTGVTFAVTTDGLIFRSDDGQSWQPEAMTGGKLYKIAGWDDAHVWAGGDNTLWSRSADGGWTSSPLAASVFALRTDADAGRLWLGGGLATVNGDTEWIARLDPPVPGVVVTPVNGAHVSGDITDFASTGSDLWAGGYHGAVFHWSGTAWDFVETGSRKTVNAMLGVPGPGGGLWLVGDYGAVLRKSN
jgi:hypothetical protein